MDQTKRDFNRFPRISVIVTSYNKEKYIAQTLQSILDQQYLNLEIVVVDDGSTDNSAKIIKAFAKKYPKIIKFFIQKNQGQIEATNFGVTKSTGQILNFLNSDDYFEPNILFEIGKCFKNDPNLLWITGYSDIVDQQNRQIYSWVTKYKNLLLRINKYFLLLIVNYITFSSVFIKRLALKKVGRISNKNNIFLEYDLWLKLGRIQKPKVIKKKLVHFRLTSDNLTFSNFRKILSEDYSSSKRQTSNKIFLGLHKLNNIGRIFLITRFTANEKQKNILN